MSSSPLLQLPSTPLSRSSHRYPTLGYGYHQPLNSSPLASPSPPKSSPVVAAQARRRSQFKSRTPSTPVASSSRSRNFPSTGSITPTAAGRSVFTGVSDSVQDSQKAFLRENFKARCFQRAVRAREKAIREKRYASEASSDGFDDSMDYDEEEDDDAVMQDELFRRIMANASSKQRHSYRLSYGDEVGSSFDPDLDDINEWERALEGLPPPSTSSPTISPVDIDDAELEAYAEECAKRAAMADFEDIPLDELFSWSDTEELDGQGHNEDFQMMH